MVDLVPILLADLPSVDSPRAPSWNKVMLRLDLGSIGHYMASHLLGWGVSKRRTAK